MSEKSPKKNRGGRPTKYTEDMPEKMVEFFARPLYEMVEVESASAGKVVKTMIERPTVFPSVEGFCASLLISKSTFHEWVKKYPLFSNALGKCKQLQTQHLVTHSLNGNFHAGFAKFLMINITDYKDKVESEVTTREIKVEVPDERATKL